MTVLGLDLSISATGWAISHHGDANSGAWRLPPSAGDRRLLQLRHNVRALLPAGVDLVVIEDLLIATQSAGITGMVHGAIRALLIDQRIPYALVPPATLKKYATGRGNATKADMRMALYKRLGADLPDDNQVDAWWLMHAGLDHIDTPILTLPDAQRSALDKVHWPKVAVAA